jgi:aspartyl-tRNA(Asn)/glutamyl-tRNA(Gln) amidotransferase subunit A
MTRREFVGAAIGTAAWHLASSRGWAATTTTSAPDPLALTLAEASAAIQSRAITSLQLTEACLARIANYDAKLGAFITVMSEGALALAKARDAELQAGKSRGPLHGIPIALKDNIDTAGVRTTAGSAVFASRVPEEDAIVVARLLAAGAVIIGKTNLYEFAMGGMSFFGPVRNPWALDRIPGGSSSGAAAALAAGLCLGAIGTDTGGSVRQPAAYCNLVGLKPTNGLVPVRGIVPGVLSLDCCGPLTRTVADAALLLNALAGYDRLDITTIERPREDYVAALRQPVDGLRIGLPTGYFDRMDPEIARVTNEALAVLAKLTRSMQPMTLPPTSPAGMDGGGSGVSAELYAYHEEFARHDLPKYMLPQRRRIEALGGTHGGDAADYVRGQWALQRLRRTIDDAFKDVDLAVMPTERDLPPKLNDYIKGTYDTTPRDPGTSFANCPPINVYGIPAISIPCGFSRDGLPIGLMIAGPNFSEGRILALAQAYERATDWTRRRPTLTPDMAVPKVDFPRE